ncbi:flagellar hook-associated protein FlgK [Fontisphaera persica]|uniref:flagellar hook-associated protein FlgK n=1 Tax=Fontisphaera persica TaxID=2974023 RepID=UPI0024BF2FCE|nr:flagellar hook-associated protein FlgK [Fontisphaera persica]WCJ58199.1 flagellar hook-associated protein FlgK [Fontisphaera persica]
MLGLFGTLDMGARSLQNQLTGIEVTGHNLANVNNPAYARQRVRFQTNTTIPTPLGPQGTGAQVVAITQLRNALLDRQLINEAGLSAYWQTQQQLLEQAETSLGQQLDRQAGSVSAAGTSGISGQMGLAENLSDLFNAFQSVAAQPASLEERQVLVQKAQALAEQFNRLAGRLTGLQSTIQQQLQDEAAAVNRLTAEIAALNHQIARTELSAKGPANDLRDLRQEKLEELGKYLNLEAVEDETGQVNVSVNGVMLVDGQQVALPLEIYDAGQGQWQVRTSDGQPLPLSSGSLAGLIETRDGPLADALTRLNQLAGALIAAVNTAHGAGFDLEGNTGLDFFEGTDAATIRLNEVLAQNPSRFQAAGVAGALGDNQTALALARLAVTAQPALGHQTFQQFYHQTVTNLGEALAQANRQVKNQEAVEQMLRRQRDAVSGVSLDEEMTEMVKFQKAFQASARLVSTVDELLETVISMKR